MRKPVTIEGGAIDPTISPGPRITFTVDSTNKRKGRKPIMSRTVPSELGDGVVETIKGRRRIRHLRLT